jgi:hypothetical protein
MAGNETGLKNVTDRYGACLSHWTPDDSQPRPICPVTWTSVIRLTYPVFHYDHA